ncbi:hypothetical protein B0H14DRAFT_2253448, partial [Mycena olivaceomarginata]
FLDEIVRHDGRGDYVHQTVCAGFGCEAAEPSYRCLDCIHPCLYCESCLKTNHERTPFHHIGTSSRSSFPLFSLKSLKVPIQLSHTLGERCPYPARAWGDDFVIVGSHIIDEIGLGYCDC